MTRVNTGSQFYLSLTFIHVFCLHCWRGPLHLPVLALYHDRSLADVEMIAFVVKTSESITELCCRRSYAHVVCTVCRLSVKPLNYFSYVFHHDC